MIVQQYRLVVKFCTNDGLSLNFNEEYVTNSFTSNVNSVEIEKV